MSKHTPGPWVVSANSPFLVRAGDDTTGRHIAHAGPASYHPSFEVDEPNARLIAAAPELLEALERLVTEIILSDVDMEYIDSHFKPHIEKARAAVAKATGGYP